MYKSLPCPSLWWYHLDLKTNIYGYISIFPRQHLIQVSIIYTHMTEFRQPLQVQSHLEMPGILVQLGHIQRT